MSDYDPTLEQIRQFASDGHNAEDVMLYVMGLLGGRLEASAFQVESYLFQAFSVPLSSLRAIEDWDEISLEGRVSTAQLADALRPWLESRP